jgi:hypothetical protein
MTDWNRSLETHASEELIEVRGCLSRTEWELVYLAASKFAQSRGLSIVRFDLKPAELDGQQHDKDAQRQPPSPSDWFSPIGPD